MADIPDPNDPLLSIAYVLGNTLGPVADVLARIADSLERIAERLDDGTLSVDATTWRGEE